ncbi:MAG: hypothetical protein ACP5RH_03880 [Leptodesmis sp.]|uniref:hypothetical protein n=1 Tax=Leptodesmis sp. TaxID=3100501 RepID=UPI003D0FA0EB
MGTASNHKLDTLAVLASLTVPIFETPKKLFPQWVEVNGKMECCWVEVENGARSSR